MSEIKHGESTASKNLKRKKKIEEILSEFECVDCDKRRPVLPQEIMNLNPANHKCGHCQAKQAYAEK